MSKNKSILILLGLFILTFTSCQQAEYLSNEELDALELKGEKGEYDSIFLTDDPGLEKGDDDDIRPDGDDGTLHFDGDQDDDADDGDTINDDDEDDIEDDDDTINDDDEDDIEDEDDHSSLGGSGDRTDPRLRKSGAHTSKEK